MSSPSASLVEFGASLLERRGVGGKGFGVVVDMALITAAAIGAAHIVWVVVSPVSFVKLEAGQGRASTAEVSSQLTANPQIFTTFDPFNRNLNAVTVTEKEAPETSLNLKIRSLFASTEPGMGSVRIELPDGTQTRFTEGDTIVSGVRLERILSDRVILERRGEREVLFASEKRVLDIVTPDGQPLIDPTPDTKITGNTTPQVRVSELSISNLNELLSKVQIRRTPADDGGAPELAIISTSDAAFLNQLGFQVNDVLMDINGYDLRQTSLNDVSQRLQHEKQLNFRIRRNKETLMRSIRIGN